MPSSPFGSLLKDQRRAHGLTQERLAELAGCAVVTLKKIEAGRLRPSSQIAERLADVLAVPPAERTDFIALARGVALDAGLRQQELHGYVLHERLGAGGFGVVYRATQPSVHRDVAIKIILPLYANRPEFIRRFEAEAQIVAALEHPYIVPLYDYWRDSSGAFLVMRWMRGGSLANALRHGPWAFPAALRLIEQIGAALAVAHRQRLVHCDVKPTNVLLDSDGNAYLADFGIAKHLDSAAPGTQTQAGVLLGSPEYLAPEQLHGGSVTPQTDIYSFGILIYELLTGMHPLAGVPPGDMLSWKLHHALPSVSERRSDLPTSLDAVLQRASSASPTARYADLLELVRDLQLADQDAPHTASAYRTLFEASSGMRLRNPYKGLRAFQEADAALFFGRAMLIERLLQRLAQTQSNGRVLLVVGASGCGKSSLVRAGLLPALRQGRLAGSERWFVTSCMPGPYPLEEIEAALLRVAVNPPEHLLQQLRADERGLLRTIERILPDDQDVELVLLIDQFEELFTLLASEDERAFVLRSLLTATQAARSRLRLIVTLRADFFDRPLSYPGWDELLRSRVEIVTLLEPDQVRKAITAPAHAVGLHLEKDLTEAILTDLHDQPGALPLLQYALTELFERRSGTLLSLSSYYEIGGIAGALVRRADLLYESLTEAEQQAARQLFLRLVAAGAESDDTRRRVPLQELFSIAGNDGTWEEALRQIVERFGQYRLLSLDRDPITRNPTVEVAHEALIQRWPLLHSWIDECRANLRLQQRLAEAAREWQQQGEDASFLATGARLVQFETLLSDTSIALNTAERSYLQASLHERDQQIQREQERQAVLHENLAQAEALRLASLALRLLQEGRNSEAATLLALRSIRLRYTPQGDEALARAAQQPYASKMYAFSGSNFSIAPDAQSVACVLNSDPLGIFDLGSGEQIAALDHNRAELRNVHFSPDGQLLATCDADGMAYLWDWASAECLRSWRVASTFVAGLAFAPDGQSLLTGAYDGAIRLWDVESGQERQHYHLTAPAADGLEHSLAQTTIGPDVAMAPDGQAIAAATNDGRIVLWDAQTGSLLLLLSGHRGTVWGLAFSPDSVTFGSGGSDSTVRIWDRTTGQERFCCRGHSEAIQRVVFSPDGKTLASCSDDGAACLWDVATGRIIQRFVAYNGFVFAVGFTPDGQQLMTSSGTGIARLWNIQQRPYLPTLEGHVAVYAPDGQSIATGDRTGLIRLWDAASGDVIRTIGQHTAEVVHIAFSSDGRQILTGSSDYSARVWDCAAAAQRHVLLGHTRPVRTVILSPDQRLIMSVSDDGTARLWDAATGEAQHVLTHAGQVFDAAFSPDGSLIATACVDGTTRLWETATVTELHVFQRGSASVAFSRDGRLLIAGAWDGFIKIWRLDTKELVAELRGHSATVWLLRTSPDRRMLLSASSDRTARLWDLETFQEIRQLIGHSAGLASAEFSPDGQHILTSSFDGMVRIWDYDYHSTISYLQNRMLRDFDDLERVHYGIV